jgi:hypothetical protein
MKDDTAAELGIVVIDVARREASAAEQLRVSIVGCGFSVRRSGSVHRQRPSGQLTEPDRSTSTTRESLAGRRPSR